MESAILAKIKKIKALTTSSNEGEAANAAALMQELLLKHNLSISDVDGFNPDSKPEDNIEYHRVDEDTVDEWMKNRKRWELELANHIARNNLCEVIYLYRGVSWVGRPMNIEVCQFMFASLRFDLDVIANTHWNAILELRDLYYRGLYKDIAPELLTVHGKAWKNSFLLGAVSTIGRRLRDAKRHLSDNVEGMNALIVQSDRELQIALKAFFPNLTTDNTKLNVIKSAYDTGKAAGEKVQFKHGLGAGGSKAPKMVRG